MADENKVEYLQFATESGSVSELFRIPHTYDEVGAAPAGYGYGDYQYLGAEAGESLTEKIDALTVSWSDRTTKQYLIFDHDFYSYVIIATISKFNNDYILITGTTYNGNQVIRRKNVVVNGEAGVWQKWEWVNPPMVLGQEYRTTERIGGAPVYVKMIGIEKMNTPNVSHSVNFNTQIPNARILRYYFLGSGSAYDFTTHITSFNFGSNHLSYKHNWSDLTNFGAKIIVYFFSANEFSP